MELLRGIEGRIHQFMQSRPTFPGIFDFRPDSRQCKLVLPCFFAAVFHLES